MAVEHLLNLLVSTLSLLSSSTQNNFRSLPFYFCRSPSSKCRHCVHCLRSTTYGHKVWNWVLPPWTLASEAVITLTTIIIIKYGVHHKPGPGCSHVRDLTSPLLTRCEEDGQDGDFLTRSILFFFLSFPPPPPPLVTRYRFSSAR
ncbi:hypothetical protein ASPZODRAFT_445052 [Penicilliopsis zonata CBS 506.65]|uniref:Uncharacterized protein n=1 Tax=Penicilliopsis zonata CBS 506.65 TaxID=1073090 RepID=A0A1L9SX72_9EURO|nr:hypothetical protein ASPZODRAFT_445052 [Penicilliopsis zonata CBS 506.65]OJJ51663.1 hypothetical protein ASPZODRAFT_445052 [Penicilliopsis zonata CBS 506.65]